MRLLLTLALAASLSVGAAAAQEPAVAAPEPGAAAIEAPAQAQPQASEAAPPATEANAAEETGRIIFFRPSRLTGAVYTYQVVEVGDDGKKSKQSPRLGDLPNGGAFVYDAPAGVHSFNIAGPMAVNLAEDRLRMEVEPGQTYYVEQTVRMGVLTGGFRLTPADEARFVKSKAKIDKGKKVQKAEKAD